MAMDLEPGNAPEGEGKPKRKKRASTTPGAEKHRKDTAAMIREVGMALPKCPTNPDELAAQWQLPSEALYSINVKILRAIKGSREAELVDEVAGIDYHLGPITGKYGPGMYYIRGGGQYSEKLAKMLVSEEMARKNGWGRAPEMPSAADLQAQRVIAEAVDRPTNPLDLAAAMELAAKRAASEAVKEAFQLYGITGPVNTARPMGQPTGQIEGMNQFREMMNFMRDIREDARKDVERSMGISKPEPSEERPWWAEMVASFAPIVGGIINARTAPQARPATAQPTIQQRPPAAQPATQEQPRVNGEPMTHPVEPELSAEELAILRPAVNMLAPWGDQLVQLGDHPGLTEQDAANELVGFIAPVFYESLIRLDGLVEARGPAVLRHIHPGMATERWKSILHALAVNLKAEEE